MGDFEPFFCSFALYDLKNQKKISEDFHFDANREETLSLLAGYKVNKPEHAYSKCKKAHFSIPEASAEIYLVLFIHKVLQGDLSKVREPYMTDFQNVTKISKVQTKVKQTAPEFCAQLGSHRQLFAWSAVCVYDQQTNFVLQEGSKVYDNIYPLDMKDIFQTLNIIKNEKSINKQKLIRGFFSMKVEVLKTPKPIENFLDPMFNLNFTTESSFSSFNKETESVEHMQTMNEKKFDVKYVKEIECFSRPVTPKFNWVNNLYVYPIRADLSSQKQIKANFVIKIQLKSSEETVLECFYGKSSSPLFTDEYLTHCSHKQKIPYWLDEVKIKLPNKLSEKHHLLFTFYSVNTSYKKSGSSALIQKFGYAFLPLYRNYQFVKHNRGEYSTLPVIIMDELPPKYLSFPDVIFNKFIIYQNSFFINFVCCY